MQNKRNQLVKTGVTFVSNVPVPSANRRAAVGASIGGVSGLALAAAAFAAGPVGLALAAAVGAGTGAFIGAHADQNANR